MIRAIAIDDEPLAMDVLEVFCKQLADITLVSCFTDPSEAYKYLKSNPIDLLFLDINMPSISGIDFYKRLEEPIPVIFTTAHPEFAVQGFDLSAEDYLLKPISAERFQQAVQKVLRKRLSESVSYTNQYLIVTSNYRRLKIDISTILYLESLNDYVKIHLQNEKPVLVRSSFASILDKLSPNEIVRVHRSFAVNVKHVQYVQNKSAYIAGNLLPISVSYEKPFLAVFLKP